MAREIAVGRLEQGIVHVDGLPAHHVRPVASQLPGGQGRGHITFLVLFDRGMSNMDGSPANYSDALAFILSAVTAMTGFVFLILFCLPSKKYKFLSNLFTLSQSNIKRQIYEEDTYSCSAGHICSVRRKRI